MFHLNDFTFLRIANVNKTMLHCSYLEYKTIAIDSDFTSKSMREKRSLEYKYL